MSNAAEWQKASSWPDADAWQKAYGKAYAKWAPIMRARWCNSNDMYRMEFASKDIHMTLRAQGESFNCDPDYNAKLWAELDAIRDRRHTLEKKNGH